MKTLFEFTLPKRVETEETITTEVDGKKVTTTSTVIKEIPLKLAIKKPTRDISDAGKLFYSVKISEALKEGVISEVLLRKRLTNDGGALSDLEKAEFGELYLSLFQKQSEYSEIDKKAFNDLTDKEKELKKSLTADIGVLSQKLSNFESNHSQLFENTAESYARNHTMRWNILQLAYVQKLNDKNEPQADFVPLFPGNDYNAKLKSYDNLEESEDPFYIKAVRKLAHLISYFYIQVANTPEEFMKLSMSYDNELAANESVKVEPEKADDPDEQVQAS